MGNQIVKEQKVVVIVQRVLPHYRISFFARLRERLLREGIYLRLVYGQEYPGTIPRTVDFDADWAVRIDNRYVRIGGLELVWQPCRAYLADADLVIVEQANRLLVNYLLMARQFQDRGRRLAIFAHGRNMQSREFTLRERMKRHMLGAVDWCFVYTQASADTVTAGGISTDQLTVVNNTIDTELLSNALAVVASRGRMAVRSELGLGCGPVALYCGSLYRGKRLGFLIEACLAIRRSLPDFVLLVIGDGPDRNLIVKAAQCHPWIQYLGPLFGTDRAPYMVASDVLLMPGQVGLAIVDSFVAETPLFTTDVPVHSPEIAYLENGINGVMTTNSIDVFASAVIEYFSCAALQERLKEGCRRSAQQYTMEQMVENFSRGIVSSLKTR
jgi:glycosyltransferase involved in cell wall biosynthesis